MVEATTVQDSYTLTAFEVNTSFFVGMGCGMLLFAAICGAWLWVGEKWYQRRKRRGLR